MPHSSVTSHLAFPIFAFAFNQVGVLERNQYGRKGEALASEVYPFRPAKDEHIFDHLMG